MDEDFGSITINLSTERHTSFREKKKSNVQGDRASRIKQRRQAKLENKKVYTTSTPDSHRDHGVKRKSEEEHGSEPKKKKDDGIISSLFRKNPDIPNIVSSKVEEVIDQVFTGKTFKELPLHPYLISNLEDKQGFKEMTEIQRLGIPVIMRGKDSLIKSQTGSGKTLCYAVPIIHALQARAIKVQRSDGPYALVIVPTRELAIQSYETFMKLVRSFVWIVPGCLMGGEKKKAEKSRLRKGVNVLVATPGRLLDHLTTTGALSLSRARWLVIDEADRLLEMGYEKDISSIMSKFKEQCPDPPQTVLLSATLSEGVERLSSVSLTDPEHVKVSDGGVYGGKSSKEGLDNTHAEKQDTESSRGRTFTLPGKLKQQFLVTPCKLRLVTLAALVLQHCQFKSSRHKMIVFMSTQDSVAFHAQLFTHMFSRDTKEASEKLKEIALGQDSLTSKDAGNLLTVFQLHGDMSQKDRSKTFAKFGKAKAGVLLCTDVAARGLDLPNVDLIVQYTCPTSTVDYIHRVGRTARAGGEGRALLFLMPAETGYVQELNQHNISLTQTQAASVLQPLLDHIDDLPQPPEDNKRQRPVTVQEAATHLQDRLEDAVRGEGDLKEAAARGFQSFVRAYAAYSKELKEYCRVSQLHLGHVAKSFGLREAPGKVSGVAGPINTKKEKRPKGRPLSFKAAALSESSSGLEAGKKIKSAVPGKFNKKKKKKKLFANS